MNSSSGHSKTGQDFILTAFGLITSSLTALFLALFETKLGFAIYSMMWWFVVPVGALLAGFGGASGYYLGARLFHHRPTRLLLFNMVSIAIGTYFLVNWFNYSFTVIDGRSISEMIPFSQYLDVMLTHQAMEFRFHGAKLGETGDLGSFGYVTAALQVIGFAVGGLGVYLYLQADPYCEACRKYLRETSTTTCYANDAEEFKEFYRNLISHLQQGDIGAASQLMDDSREKGQDVKQSRLKAELSLWKCETCPQEFFESTVNRRSGKEWKAINDLQIRDYTRIAV